MPGGGYALPGLLVRSGLSPGPASNCAAGRWHQARSCVYAGWRLRPTRPTRPAPTVCWPGKQRRRRAMASGTELRLCRVAAARDRPTRPAPTVVARQATAPGDGIRHGVALCRVAAAPYPAYNPKSPLALGLLNRRCCGLNIAETFASSPHGCGLRRAVLHGRRLGPTRPAGISRRTAQRRCCGRTSKQGRRRLAAPCALAP
jgi:hypothetical protein